MQRTFKIKSPLPKYGAEESLSRQLLIYLRENHFQPGETFLTDAEIIAATRKSRTVVRRSLSRLQNDGWIERKVGQGTFVTKKIEYLNELHEASATTPELLRFALVHINPERSRVWSRQSSFFELVGGFTKEAAQMSVTLELLGDNSISRASLCKSFEQTRPNLLICLGTPGYQLTAISEALHYGIPVLLGGVRSPEFNLPCIVDDSIQGARMAVEKLYEAGHQRIAFIQTMGEGGQWVFDRFRGYRQGLESCGLDYDGRLVEWLPMRWTGEENRIEDFILKNKPTAVIFGSLFAVSNLDRLVEENRIHVPDDISVITFDGDPSLAGKLGGRKMTSVNLPFNDIGRLLVEYGVKLVHKEHIPLETRLPCVISEGVTVRNI